MLQHIIFDIIVAKVSVCPFTCGAQWLKTTATPPLITAWINPGSVWTFKRKHCGHHHPLWAVSLCVSAPWLTLVRPICGIGSQDGHSTSISLTWCWKRGSESEVWDRIWIHLWFLRRLPNNFLNKQDLCYTFKNKHFEWKFYDNTSFFLLHNQCFCIFLLYMTKYREDFLFSKIINVVIKEIFLQTWWHISVTNPSESSLTVKIRKHSNWIQFGKYMRVNEDFFQQYSS